MRFESVYMDGIVPDDMPEDIEQHESVQKLLQNVDAWAEEFNRYVDPYSDEYAQDMQEERDKQWYEDWEAVEDVIADIEYRQNVLAQSFTLEDVRNRLEWLKRDQADGTIAIVR